MSIQETISKVLWDKRYVIIPDYVEGPSNIEYVVLHDLTVEDRNTYAFLRDLEEKRARDAGVPTEGELKENARLAGFWTEVEDEIESCVDDHIKFLEAEFESKKKFRSRQNIIKVQIEDALAKKKHVENRKSTIRMNSADYLAHEIAIFDMVRKVVYDNDGNLLFKNDNYFIEIREQYPLFVYFLVQEVVGEDVMDIIDIREIARSTEWRLVWALNKENLSGLFNRPVSDLTLNHRMLIYWSRIYDSAFESHEPPEMDVINNDDRFDNWLANRDLNRKEEQQDDKTNHHKERCQVLDGGYIEECTCGSKQENVGKGLGERIPHADNCRYGCWYYYSADEKEKEASRIYDRNSQAVRKVLDREQDQVLKKGVVEEQDLRGTKTRHMLGMETKVIPIRK